MPPMVGSMSQKKPICKYKKPHIKNLALCELNYYGGMVTIGNCNQCIKMNQNTPEAKAAFDAKGERTHPSNRKRIQGCCDRADQA